MINGLGVLGWGVGGIEAEAAMLGQPVTMLIPQVIGFKLNGSLQAGATATDLVLTVTEMLRKKGVVDKFVEFFGDGLANLPLADRATIAQHVARVRQHLRASSRSTRRRCATSSSRAARASTSRWSRPTRRRRACGASNGAPPADYTDVLELDLGTVEPSLAGPKRPQDRVPLRTAKSVYQAQRCKKMAEERATKNPGGHGHRDGDAGRQDVRR